MIKQILSISFMAITLASCAINGSDKNVDKTPATRSFSVGQFTGIDSSCGIQVTYTQGNLEPVTVTAPEYLFEYLTVKVKDGTLDVSVDDSFFRMFNSLNESIAVTVSAPEVRNFEASSGSSISVKNALSFNGSCQIEASSGASVTLPSLKASSLDTEISSGASVSIDLCKTGYIGIEASSAGAVSISGIESNKVNAEASSGASVNIDGITEYVSAEATSGASINGSNLFAKFADVEASSGGDVNYNAVKANTDISISGAASNHYRQKAPESEKN